MDKIKKLLSYLPQNNIEEPQSLAINLDDPNRLDTNLINVLPDNPYQSYDIKSIIMILSTMEFLRNSRIFAAIHWLDLQGWVVNQ